MVHSNFRVVNVNIRILLKLMCQLNVFISVGELSSSLLVNCLQIMCW